MSELVIALMENKEQSCLVQACLSGEGYAVRMFNSFPMAMPYLKSQPCGLIISDVHLENGGNVFDFLRWVKKESALCAIPFVLLSIHPSVHAKYLTDGVRLAARALDAAKYISMEKFDATLLLEELSELLPQHKDLDEQRGNSGGKKSVQHPTKRPL